MVLAPAYQWLFTPFDHAVGHYRRYTARTLRALTPEAMEPVRVAHLDSVGLLASAANRVLLRQSMPNPGQIAVWDRFMVPLSKLVDPMTGGLIGKSVLGIWWRRAS